MAPKVKLKTRATSEERYGGSPCALPESDLPTNSDVARYFYLVCTSEKDYATQLRLVMNKVVEVWENCNPAMPLREKKNISVKLKTFIDNVKSFNRKGIKAPQRKHLSDNKDKLFDIAACSCKLPIVPCSSVSVKCTEEDCDVEHIVCECPPGRKVPIEERAYMRDQRAKIGTRGSFQLGPKDRLAAAKESARQKRKGKSLMRPPPQRMDEVLVNPEFEVCVLCLYSFFNIF
jgi:hypothetical protein